jgi:hypothetical protein
LLEERAIDLQGKETSQDKLEESIQDFLDSCIRGNGDTKLVGVAPVETQADRKVRKTKAGIYHPIPFMIS